MSGEFIEHLNKATEIVSKWPSWKQRVLGTNSERPIMISEDKVRELLNPIGDKIQDLSIKDDLVSFNVGEIFYEITPTVVRYSDDNSDGWETMSHHGYRKEWSNEHAIGKAVNTIASMFSQPSTLEEKVREILKGTKGISEQAVEQADSDKVVLKYKRTSLRDIVYPGNKMDTYCGRLGIEIADTSFIPEYKEALEQISALLPPPPQTETERLEERVRELEELVDKTNDNAKHWNKEWIALNGKFKTLQAENESLIEKFGPIDEAEQKASASVTELAGLIAKRADIDDEIFQMLPELTRNIAIEVYQTLGRANRPVLDLSEGRLHV